MGNEACENCRRTIGKLEQAYVYEGRVVCKQCNETLRHPRPEHVKRSNPVGISVLTGTLGGFVLGFLLMHYGCEPRTFESHIYFIFNFMLAIPVGIFGALIGLGIGLLVKRDK